MLDVRPTPPIRPPPPPPSLLLTGFLIYVTVATAVFIAVRSSPDERDRVPLIGAVLWGVFWPLIVLIFVIGHAVIRWQDAQLWWHAQWKRSSKKTRCIDDDH